MKSRHVIWLAGALLLASAFAGVGAPVLAHALGGDTKPGTVEVNGLGTVDVVPDTATLSFGVTTQAKTAVDARAKAEALGEAGHFSVGPIDSVAEQSSSPVVEAGPRTGPVPAPGTPIEPGTQQVQATVTVTFQIS